MLAACAVSHFLWWRWRQTDWLVTWRGMWSESCCNVDGMWMECECQCLCLSHAGFWFCNFRKRHRRRAGTRETPRHCGRGPQDWGACHSRFVMYWRHKQLFLIIIVISSRWPNVWGYRLMRLPLELGQRDLQNYALFVIRTLFLLFLFVLQLIFLWFWYFTVQASFSISLLYSLLIYHLTFFKTLF